MTARSCSRIHWFTAVISTVVLVLLSGAGLVLAEESQAPKKPTNVLLITLTSTRADHLGCYGAKGVKTPNLDRLAAEGVRFARASACTPLTMPSHSTIMTGTWPSTHGVRSNGEHVLDAGRATLAEVLKNRGYETSGVISAYTLKKVFGISQGIKYFDDRMAPNEGAGLATERPGTLVGDTALEHLKRLHDSAFFMWVHFNDPRYPYLSDKGREPDSALAYREEIQRVDLQVGRLLKALADSPAADRTLVVVVGDHGEGLGDHGESEHGYLLYESTLRVPLIMWAPGLLPAKKVVSVQVRTVDLMPTILDYVEVQAPPTVQGVTLRALIDGPGELARRMAYSEAWLGQNALGLSVLRAVTVGQWKYIDSGEPQLFDLEKDPAEEHNVVATEEILVERLRRSLTKMLGDDLKVAPLGGSGPEPTAHLEQIDQYRRAVYSIRGGDLDSAESDLRKVLQVLPEAPVALLQLARVLRKLDRGDEVEPLVLAVLEKNPSATGVRMYLARRLMQENRAADAVPQYAKVVKDYPDYFDAQYELGKALYASGKPDTARKHLDKAHELTPDNAGPLLTLARLSIDQEKYDLANDYVQAAARAEPDSNGVQNQVSRLLTELDKVDLKP